MQTLILSDAEMETLLTLYVGANPDGSEEVAIALIRWAEKVRLGATVLDLILNGTVVATGIDDDGFPLVRLANHP